MTLLRGHAHTEPFRTIADALPSDKLVELLDAVMWGTKLRKEWKHV